MPEIPTNIVETLNEYAEKYSIEKYPSKHREHLGISLIGEECWRKIWYSFRWVKLEQHEGRMRRLFNRGHREEAEFEKFLFWAGFKQTKINPLTDNYYKVSSLNGHYGGTPDDVWLIRWANNLQILAEYKTHNNKSFEELKAKKVKVSKPQHYAQMCGYGEAFQIKYGLYFAVNKDNDEWHFEFLELDWLYAKELEKKAETIILAKEPPPRISEQASYWKCKFCVFQDICFHGECVESNCRSCKHSIPTEKATWACDKYGVIPVDFIVKGCPEHQDINQ